MTRKKYEAYDKQYRLDNREKLNEGLKNWCYANPAKVLWYKAKQRARQKNIDFTIDETDVVVPTHCPILGIPLMKGRGRRGPTPNSPTLDRIDPTQGYIKGNVQVISDAANRMKSNASPQDLIAFAKWVLFTYQDKKELSL